MSGEGALAMVVDTMTIVCPRCEAQANLLFRGHLPEGWRAFAGQPFCPDCAQSLVSRKLARPDIVSPVSPPAPAVIGPTSPASRYRGLRLEHSITADAVALGFRGGSAVVGGVPDRVVNCVVDGHELDQLISRLQLIQLELNSSGPRGII